MLDFYRRLWQAFFVAVPVWVGIAYLFKDYHVVFIILLILALICLIVALIGLYYDYLDARKKVKQEKIDADRKALREAFKRMHPEWTDKQLDIAVNGR